VSDPHAEAVERAFSQQAETFERQRIFTTDSEWLFERLELRPDDLVLEVAAGTGHVSRTLAPRVRAVVALDATAAMLAQATRAPNVVYMQGDAAALPFVDGSFDVVVCRFALHHFERPEVQVAEMRRCARGRLAVGDLVADPDDRETQDRLERLRDPSHTRLLTADEIAALIGPDIEVRDLVRPLGPWLAQTETPEDRAAQIRAALRDELAGGPATGFRPRLKDGELHFTHSLASAIG
jgi:SAM-dependent methyltransferase